MSTNSPQSSRHSSEYVNLRDYAELLFNTLRDYVDVLFCERDKATKIALAEQVKHQEAQDKATASALVSMNLRMDAANEIKGAMKDSLGQYATRIELAALKEWMESAIGGVNNEIRGLRESRATLEGKASQSSVDSLAKSTGNARAMAITGTIVGVAGLILSILSWLF